MDGACYRVTLSYQDGAGNPEASVFRSSAGNVTMPLLTFEFVSNKRIKETFVFVYIARTLPRGSLSMT